MATYLYRLAQGSFRHRRWVLAAWLLLLALLGVGAAALKTPSIDSFTIPGVQAQQASDLLMLTAIIGVGVGLAALFMVGHWVELSATSRSWP